MILAIIQARMSSTRLPGKVLLPLAGEPMLMRQVERIRHSRKIDRLLIATSSDVTDDPIEELCAENGLLFFRGNLNDVLDRFYHAAKPYMPVHIVRLTGDCPLSDPHVIDQAIDFYLKECVDYASNLIEPTFPDGLEVEVFRFSCLQTAWEEAKLASEREHVTPFIYKNQGRFKIAVFKNNQDLSSLRWTVDEPADYDLIQNIFSALHREGNVFHMPDILKYLDEKPMLKSINSHYRRNEGYEKSLLLDKTISMDEDQRKTL